VVKLYVVFQFQMLLLRQGSFPLPGGQFFNTALASFGRMKFDNPIEAFVLEHDLDDLEVAWVGRHESIVLFLYSAEAREIDNK
jgi:hypothetical protein